MCEDCGWRKAEYRIHYKGGGTAVFCAGDAPFCWVTIDEAGRGEFIERIADQKLIAWGRNPKAAYQ